MIFLHTLGITDIDSWSISNKVELTLNVTALGQVRVLYFRNLMYFALSNDLLECEDQDENGVSIVEVTHEYRHISSSELNNYKFLISKDRNIVPQHIVKFHGGTIFEIICEELEISEQPTESKH